ncbi:MAG TPA: hypothetical protein PLN85_00910 [archaeon]|nr:hypothetical protein [archaeon]
MEELTNDIINQFLIQIENEINNFEKNNGFELEFNENSIYAITSLFTMAIVDKLQKLQKEEKLSMEDTINMASSVGGEINKIMKKYVNIENINDNTNEK